MIIAEQKPVREIVALTKDAKSVLVIGCGACVAICFAGGEKETDALASGLLLAAGAAGRQQKITSTMTLRQCEWEYVDSMADVIEAADVVVSTACGVGAQTIAERFPTAVIVPGLNTTSMGMPVEQGVWQEYCAGCGSCVIAYTGGLCPIARCAKSLMNGPCGGSQGGVCEVSPDTQCVWQLIYDKLKAQGRLHLITEYAAVKDWRTARDGGPRKTVREDLRLPDTGVSEGSA